MKETAPLPPRPKLTTLQKLRIVARYCRCPGLIELNHKCGKPLGDLSATEFDHIGARVFTGDDSEENYRPLCKECHDVKTFGRGGEKRITTADGDVGKLARVRDLSRSQEEFRRRLLTKEPGKERPKSSRWPKRMLRGRAK